MLPNDAVGVSSWRAIEMSYDRGAIRRPGVFLLFIYLGQNQNPEVSVNVTVRDFMLSSQSRMWSPPVLLDYTASSRIQQGHYLLIIHLYRPKSMGMTGSRPKEARKVVVFKNRSVILL